MKSLILKCYCCVCLTALLINGAMAQHRLVVDTRTRVAAVQPTMWGVFFEDINFGADGGIYAELVKNRSFEFEKPMMGWKTDPSPAADSQLVLVNNAGTTPSNPRSLRINLTGNSTLSLTNEGFRGMGIKKGVRYDFSLLYRERSPGLKMRVELIAADGRSIASAELQPAAPDTLWHRQAVSFTANETEAKAALQIHFSGKGKADIDMISLFPGDTWKKRPGGLRADMVQLLADLKPGFIRFPGGCIVEGFDLAQRYRWKNTIGALEDRQLIINRWNKEFSHRPAPDYFQTFGLGFFEYFQLAEDIGAEALPILNCGMACQFNTGEVAALSELDPYVQDALDLIEFANGDTATVWGKRRAEMGHPAPFGLKILGVGNENWGPQYIERAQIFQKAIKNKYPDIRLVFSSGTDPAGDRFEYLDKELRRMNADIIDEHYYRNPEWFLQNVSRYDSYDRRGPKIFAGEYAAQTEKIASPDNKNNWLAALYEAAFMTGLERNAAVVHMASYAPLFAHAEGWQWTPDLIWVDNLRSFGTPNYYVQKLFSVNKGTHILQASINGINDGVSDSVYISAGVDENKGEIIIKFVNASSKKQQTDIVLSGLKHKPGPVTLQMLKAEPADVNSFTDPQNISPQTSTLVAKRNSLVYPGDPYSVGVITIKYRGN